MKTKRSIPIIFILFFIITARGLYKLFDFDAMHFNKPFLAILYAVTLVLSVFFIVKGFTEKQKAE